MAYIGTIPAEAYTSFAVQHFTTSATDTFTLDFPVANENEIALFINNVRQEPGSSYAYTASGTTLTLSSAITGSDSMYCVFIGKAVQTVTPASGSVTNDMLAGSIANAKLANSSVTVNGTSIALGASGTISTGITNAQLFRLTTGFTGAQVITSNWEEADTDDAGSIGSFVSQSSGIFSFSQTGIYLIYFQVAIHEDADQRLFQIQIQSTPDNSTYNEAATGYTFLSAQFPDICFSTMHTQFIFDCADTTNDKIRFYTGVAAGTTNIGDTNANKTFASFIRLGDT